MGTRGLYTFTGDGETHHVYKHSDNYPEGEHGGVHAIAKAIPFSWGLHRFEPDEFAAAFVTAHKMGRTLRRLHAKVLEASDTVSHDTYGTVPFKLDAEIPKRDYLDHESPGGVRLMKSHKDWRKVAPWDIEYHYTIKHKGELFVSVGRVISAIVTGTGKEGIDEETLFSGTLIAGIVWADELDAAQKAEIAAEEAAKTPPRATFRPRPARLMIV